MERKSQYNRKLPISWKIQNIKNFLITNDDDIVIQNVIGKLEKIHYIVKEYVVIFSFSFFFREREREGEGLGERHDARGKHRPVASHMLPNPTGAQSRSWGSCSQRESDWWPLLSARRHPTNWATRIRSIFSLLWNIDEMRIA